MKCVNSVLALVLQLAFLVSFNTVNGQTTPEARVTVIRAGRVFDSERGAFLPARDIIVRNNLIETVGENLAVPTGARVIDLRPVQDFGVIERVRFVMKNGTIYVGGQ